jgi:peptidoglycan hydrolase-like protein with peptidoglycan-binding domain
VWSLQQALINSGVQVKGGADGKFGLATSIALGKFQAMKGLSVTKSVDESTAIALGLLAAPVAKSTAKKTVAAASAPVAAPVVAESPLIRFQFVAKRVRMYARCKMR